RAGGLACGGVTAAGDQKIADLVGQNRTIRDVVRFRLKSFGGLSGSRRGGVGVDVEIPTAGGDDIVEAAALPDVLRSQHVRPQNAAGLANADVRKDAHEVRLLKAGDFA